MKNKIKKNKTEDSFFENFAPAIIVMMLVVGLSFGFSEGSETGRADSCQQQICVKDSRGNPVVNRLVTLKNSSGVTVATWYTDASGCFPGPSLPTLNSGENHTVIVCCSDCPSNEVNFTACTSTINVTACD